VRPVEQKVWWISRGRRCGRADGQGPSCPTLGPQPAHRFPTTGGMHHNNNFLLKRVPEPLVKYSHKIGSVVSSLFRSQDNSNPHISAVKWKGIQGRAINRDVCCRIGTFRGER